jgi:hypothetical protein
VLGLRRKYRACLGKRATRRGSLENAALVRRDELEQSVLKGLADSVLRIEVTDYAVARMEEALRKGHEKLNAELERMRQRKLQLEAELARLVNAIAEGQPSQSFMTAIGERERELQAITNKLFEPGPGSLRATLDELRTFAVSRLTKIPESISHPESIDLARAMLAEHFGTFTLEPTIQDGEPVSLAHGKVDFFGEAAWMGWILHRHDWFSFWQYFQGNPFVAMPQ